MVVYDSFSQKGYDISLVGGHDIRVINPNGMRIENPPPIVRKNPKWSEFMEKRKAHRRNVTGFKNTLQENMYARRVVSIRTMLRDNGKIDVWDIHDVIRNMYVEAWREDDPERKTWRGFVTGADDDNNALVGNRPCHYMRMLHPIDITDLKDVQIQAIRELRDTHIMQLFRPIYTVTQDEEYNIRRYLGIPVQSNKLIPVTTTYRWTTNNRQNGLLYKDFLGQTEKYRVAFTYSVDFPEGKEIWEIGNAEFSIVYGNLPGEITNRSAMAPQPCRACDVDKVVFSEVCYELDKIVNATRVDNEATVSMIQQRQMVAGMYIEALRLQNCELIGSIVKVYGKWGIYGVSLVDARAFWWADKQYICIQPYSGHMSPKYGAFILSDGILEDPTLALAIAKVNQLCDDSHPVDIVLKNQIIPKTPGISRKGDKLDDIPKQINK